MSYDSIIIGTGLSGLTCGLLLAKSGRRVLMVEQHHEPAPVVRGFSRGGIYFDSGFHYAGGLGEKGPLRLLLKHLGLAEKLEFLPFTAAGFDRLRIRGSAADIDLPVGMARIAAHLSQLFPQLQQEITSFLEEIEARWRDFPYLDLDQEFASSGLQSVHESSLAQRLEVFSSAPRLQTLLSMHSLLYGVAPHEASVTLNAQVAGSYFHSADGVAGGGRKLITAYLERLSECGVGLRCRAEVARILSVDGKVAGVKLVDGETILAPEVIATCNPALVPAMLPAGVLRPAYRKRLEQLQQTPSALILYARCVTPTSLLCGRNLFVCPQPGTLRVALDKPLEERPMYLAGADHCPASDRARGVIAIIPTAFDEVAGWQHSAGQRCSEYLAWKQQMTRRLLRHLTVSVPELGELDPLDLATPLTLEKYSRAPQGAIYGVGRVLGQFSPQPQTRLPGFFLSGQAVAGPGLLGTLVAGYYTCGSIIGHEPLRGELRTCR
ncbi:MAG: FAD-dependent oxidoreductase [Pelovirga sp.]